MTAQRLKLEAKEVLAEGEKIVEVREADRRPRSDLRDVPGRCWAGDQSYVAIYQIHRLYGRPAIFPVPSPQILEKDFFFFLVENPLCCFTTSAVSTHCESPAAVSVLDKAPISCCAVNQQVSTSTPRES